MNYLTSQVNKSVLDLVESTDHLDLVKAADDINTPGFILEILASCSYPDIRYLVAMNISTPQTARDNLEHDHYTHIREAAYNRRGV